MMLFHIIDDLSLWESLLKKEKYVPPTFQKTGYVHLCRSEQVEAVIKRYFPEAKELLLFLIPQKRIKPYVIWEQTEHGVYPHLYDVLRLNYIENTAYIIKEPPTHYYVLMENGETRALPLFLERFHSKKQYKAGFRFFS